MYEIKPIDISTDIFMQNGGKRILSKKNNLIMLYEKSIKSDFKLTHKCEDSNPPFPIIYMLMLSNELILISGRKFLFIFKKKNEKYSLHQNIFLSEVAEITNIKELKNGNFAVCGWYGFIAFKLNNSSDNFEIDYEIGKSLLNNDYWICDFMEIKDKKDSFIFCGSNGAYIINEKKNIKQIKFNEEIDKKFSMGRNYICQFNDDIFVFCTMQYITLVNIRENAFKLINFIEETNEKRKRLGLRDQTTVYKYDINSIIILSQLKGIFIVQIFDNERIQVNIRIKLKDPFIEFLMYIEEEKCIFFREKGNNYKLKFMKKIYYS